MNASPLLLTLPFLTGLPAPDEAPAVAWHTSYRAALDAAARSGKPLLLFQLLGRLDEEFC